MTNYQSQIFTVSHSILFIGFLQDGVGCKTNQYSIRLTFMQSILWVIILLLPEENTQNKVEAVDYRPKQLEKGGINYLNSTICCHRQAIMQKDKNE